jgi:hypothetical protein
MNETSVRYDFAQVSKWFAERSDLILLLFDSYKLDISDEFKGIIENLKNFDDKVNLSLATSRDLLCSCLPVFLP